MRSLKKKQETAYCRLLTFSIGFIILLGIASCKDDAVKLSEDERIIQLLTKGPWSLTSVSVDDIDASELFEDFSITFTKTGYTTTGTSPVWPDTGMWNFKNANEPTTIVREDGLEILINTLTKNKLELELTWDKTTISGGKSASIKGKHVFVLTR